MTDNNTEFAATGRGSLAAFEGLARRTGKSVAEIRTLAAENKLCTLFDDRGDIGEPLSTREKLARILRRADPDWASDPDLRLLRMDKMRARWGDER
jgi:hypothetical protein